MSPRRPKKKGSPPRKIYFWERILVFSKSISDLFLNWAWRLSALISVLVTVAIDWLKDQGLVTGMTIESLAPTASSDTVDPSSTTESPTSPTSPTPPSV